MKTLTLILFLSIISNISSFAQPCQAWIKAQNDSNVRNQIVNNITNLLSDNSFLITGTIKKETKSFGQTINYYGTGANYSTFFMQRLLPNGNIKWKIQNTNLDNENYFILSFSEVINGQIHAGLMVRGKKVKIGNDSIINNYPQTYFHLTIDTGTGKILSQTPLFYNRKPRNTFAQTANKMLADNSSIITMESGSKYYRVADNSLLIDSNGVAISSIIKYNYLTKNINVIAKLSTTSTTISSIFYNNFTTFDNHILVTGTYGDSIVNIDDVKKFRNVNYQLLNGSFILDFDKDFKLNNTYEIFSLRTPQINLFVRSNQLFVKVLGGVYLNINGKTIVQKPLISSSDFILKLDLNSSIISRHLEIDYPKSSNVFSILNTVPNYQYISIRYKDSLYYNNKFYKKANNKEILVLKTDKNDNIVSNLVITGKGEFNLWRLSEYKDKLIFIAATDTSIKILGLPNKTVSYYSSFIGCLCSDQFTTSIPSNYKQLITITIYPNPSYDIVSIDNLKTDNYNINLIGLDGRLIKEIYVGRVSGSLRLSLPTNVTSGIYFIQIQSGNELITRKLSIVR
ncbi:MAG: T9SS type A sorting domain-containing protein [Bacteroidota bacterium]|nr:T9SS type A sorting domain-containing protein [Bacteroidota bacterium]